MEITIILATYVKNGIMNFFPMNNSINNTSG